MTQSTQNRRTSARGSNQSPVNDTANSTFIEDKKAKKQADIKAKVLANAISGLSEAQKVMPEAMFADWFSKGEHAAIELNAQTGTGTVVPFVTKDDWQAVFDINEFDSIQMYGGQYVEGQVFTYKNKNNSAKSQGMNKLVIEFIKPTYCVAYWAATVKLNALQNPVTKTLPAIENPVPVAAKTGRTMEEIRELKEMFPEASAAQIQAM
jgi:hypothetical protein